MKQPINEFCLRKTVVMQGVQLFLMNSFSADRTAQHTKLPSLICFKDFLLFLSEFDSLMLIIQKWNVYISRRWARSFSRLPPGGSSVQRY